MEIEPDIDFQFPFMNISKISFSVNLNFFFFFTKSDNRGFFLTNIGLMWVGAIFHWQILRNGSRIQMPWSFSVLTFCKGK